MSLLFCCTCIVNLSDGLFDSQSFTQSLLGLLLKSKGLDPGQLRSVDYRQYKESQYDLLAEGLRSSLDLPALFRIIEEGISE